MSETAHRRYMAWYTENHLAELAKHDAYAAHIYSQEIPVFHMTLRPRVKLGSRIPGRTSLTRDRAQKDSGSKSIESADESPALHMSLRPRTKPNRGRGTRGRGGTTRGHAALTRGEYPPSSSNSQVKLPHFIAYALHRTKFHTSVTFAALVLLQRLKERFTDPIQLSGQLSVLLQLSYYYNFRYLLQLSVLTTAFSTYYNFQGDFQYYYNFRYLLQLSVPTTSFWTQYNFQGDFQYYYNFQGDFQYYYNFRYLLQLSVLTTYFWTQYNFQGDFQYYYNFRYLLQLSGLTASFWTYYNFQDDFQDYYNFQYLLRLSENLRTVI
ncbi:hypothetical protein BDR07DRAFT_1383868 [Suillus spraguei]|nr:hypothetical protein BDR07DRAFT_1383868 [Suillus spraguei]